ncbi:MAG: GNAT family N-acetyltransferase [Desulfobacterales bacterium]|nr:GNAT family N-acetyltransferase [Desulfobacterales bacterium]
MNETGKINQFIEGSSIYLREVRVSDVDGGYYNWLNNTKINRYLETRYFPRSRESLVDYVKSMEGNSGQFFMAICLKEGRSHVGNIKIGPVSWIHRTADIGILIGEESVWGRGVGTEAIELAAEFAFNTLNLNKLTAGCYEVNQGSFKAFSKAGFVKEGQLREQWFCDGRYVDELLLGLTREDWQAQDGKD